ncbi:nuclear polyadenylated RNA-binding protein Nab2 [Metarhizium album ARSEF 1941]|uniref:Nuclear polyadenylated RNA-binding protein Nab2 n=1 Tax=Metarhizium album (strain ARSEF 1941) TaxID=1081103 RepID=A0A0B2WY27_METAS|nr:nuclear polyadenylated RNA-binding protein Nab2 [Metarhizium album ARSEF 1941]KHN98504.1 nuclear polyadenylated RNA-binding protein Nab2 [Metarhizium album ARSEF 1941]
MSVEVSLNTPLADALYAAIKPKLIEVGWHTGSDDSANLSEYIVLMLVNGKTQGQIAADLSTDLLQLPADDTTVHDFSRWLFEQVGLLNAQLNAGPSSHGDTREAASHGMGQEGADMDTDMNVHDISELNAPTGPRSMRNGNFRGGRDRRMLGNLSKAMDRTSDTALHRVRGSGGERINTHGRTPPSGPRNAAHGRMQRNNRSTNFQAGLAAGPQNTGWMMNGQQPSEMDIVAMIEQQHQMMYQLSQQLMAGGGHNRGFGNQRRGKSLFDRVQQPHQRRGNQQAKADGSKENTEGEEDVDMSGENRNPPNPDDTLCKYNLHCTNKECKFAHQSPAAPPGVTVDVSDVCSFGAACKNWKCVGRHPSPATKLAHQGEQDCKFFPNCQNPRCPFRHPSMPLCRNGANCTTEGCKFTHVKTKCKFNPCMNPTCAFAHEEGQQGGFKDKVWTADSSNGHVSERKFVEEGGPTELVKPDETTTDQTAQGAEFIG